MDCHNALLLQPMIRWTAGTSIKGAKGTSLGRFPLRGQAKIEWAKALSGASEWAFTETCPLPKYDTGCTFCKVDLPADKPLDHERPLNGTAAIPWKHVLVLLHGVANFDDMPSKINLMPGSLAHDFELVKRELLSPMHPVTLSNALICGRPVVANRHRVRIYPDNVEVEFEPTQLRQFVQAYLVPAEKTQVYNPFAKKPEHPQLGNNADELSPAEAARARRLFSETKIEKDLVLICAHTKRDIRCGALAPPLEAEFLRVLQREGLSQQVEVGRISHIGGHAYAGNVIYFPQDSQRPVVWYGRVTPPKVQGIVTATIQNGTIIKELYRGRAER